MAGSSKVPISVWRAVLEAHCALMRLYERELRHDCDISLAWYDVLVHLDEAPERTLRMSELADRLLLSPSWLTRRIDGMAAAGLVERCRAADDGRGVCARMTAEGVALYERAARSHARAIREHFLAYLDSDEAEKIECCFRRVGGRARDRLKQP